MFIKSAVILIIGWFLSNINKLNNLVLPSPRQTSSVVGLSKTINTLWYYIYILRMGGIIVIKSSLDVRVVAGSNSGEV